MSVLSRFILTTTALDTLAYNLIYDNPVEPADFQAVQTVLMLNDVIVSNHFAQALATIAAERVLLAPAQPDFLARVNAVYRDVPDANYSEAVLGYAIHQFCTYREVLCLLPSDTVERSLHYFNQFVASEKAQQDAQAYGYRMVGPLRALPDTTQLLWTLLQLSFGHALRQTDQPEPYQRVLSILAQHAPDDYDRQIIEVLQPQS